MASEISHLGKDSAERELFMLEAETFAARPALALPSERFVCLVVADATAASAAELGAFGSWLLEQGAVYVCAWGPGCADVEEAVDYAEVDRDIETGKESAVVITTPHDEESLEDALEFFWWNVVPHPWYAIGCGSSLVITVGNPEWAAQVRAWLANGR